MPECQRLISLDHPTTPGLNPLQTIALAHELGCDAVVLRLRNYPDYQGNPYDVIADRAMRRKIHDEVQARGMFIAAANAFEIRAGTPVSAAQAQLEAAAEIGARGVSVVVYEQDRSKHFDQISEYAELCRKLQLRMLLEFLAVSGVNSLAYTLELIRNVANPALGISADSLHIARTGATAADISAVPAGLIAHAQLNDGPAHVPAEQQMDEARGERLLPGEGSFDLIGLVRALPPDVPIGVEAGSRTRFVSGVTMQDHGRAAVAAMRSVIAQALQLESEAPSPLW